MGKIVSNMIKNVNHPTHYNECSIECITAMECAFGYENTSIFALVNAFKYLWRHSQKKGLEDLYKAKWYLDYYEKTTNEQDLIELYDFEKSYNGLRYNVEKFIKEFETAQPKAQPKEPKELKDLSMNPDLNPYVYTDDFFDGDWDD